MADAAGDKSDAETVWKTTIGRMSPTESFGSRGSEKEWERDLSASRASVKHGLFVTADDMKERVRTNLLKPQYNVANYYRKGSLWTKLAKKPWFENTTLAVISFNALWISIDTDNNPATTLLQAEPIFQIAEQGFCVYFSFEWFVRFMSFEKKRNGLKDKWFCFDSALVFMMVVETWVLTAVMIMLGGGGGSSPLGNAAILRLLRLLRLSRMARMLRSMPELMILIKGMVAAARSVFFTMCLLFIVIYIFAIALTQLADGTDAGEHEFRTIPKTMYMLLIHGTFLDSVGPFADSIIRSSTVLALIFYVFVAIAALMVMNILIGVLCEVVSAVAETEREEMTVSFVKGKMKAIVDHIDEDGDGTISKKEFSKILEKFEAVSTLQEIGVDPVGLVDFRDFIFEGEDGEPRELGFGEFMDVVLKMRGSNMATVKDVMNLTKVIRGEVERLEDKLLSPESPFLLQTERVQAFAAPMQDQRPKSSSSTSLPNDDELDAALFGCTGDSDLMKFHSAGSIGLQAKPPFAVNGFRPSPPPISSGSDGLLPPVALKRLEGFMAAAQEELKKFQRSPGPHARLSERGSSLATSTDDLDRWAVHMDVVLGTAFRELQELKRSAAPLWC